MMERSHAFITFPAIAVYLLFTNTPLDIAFLLYGLLLCIFILFQGQYYFKLKLQSIKGITIDQNTSLLFFRKSKKLNLIFIGLIPFVFILQVFLNNWTIKTENMILMWSGKTGLEKSQIKPEITHPYETRTKKVHQ
jgi:hypothetical protein